MQMKSEAFKSVGNWNVHFDLLAKLIQKLDEGSSLHHFLKNILKFVLLMYGVVAVAACSLSLALLYLSLGFSATNLYGYSWEYLQDSIFNAMMIFVVCAMVKQISFDYILDLRKFLIDIRNAIWLGFLLVPVAYLIIILRL